MRIGVSPIAWALGSDGSIRDDEATLRRACGDIRSAGVDAIAATPSRGVEPARFDQILREHAMTAAPGYFSARLAEPLVRMDGAKRHASAQAERGILRTFVADDLNEARVTHPGVGHDFSTSRLSRISENLAQIVEAMASEGVRAALHPHVGTGIETEAETRFMLDADPALDFGPDLGHLAWARADIAGLLRDYRRRIGILHVKDVDVRARDRALASGASYWDTVLRGGLWAEIGRGDGGAAPALQILDLDRVDWLVLECDVPAILPLSESVRLACEWVKEKADTRSTSP